MTDKRQFKTEPKPNQIHNRTDKKQAKFDNLHSVIIKVLGLQAVTFHLRGNSVKMLAGRWQSVKWSHPPRCMKEEAIVFHTSLWDSAKPVENPKQR